MPDPWTVLADLRSEPPDIANLPVAVAVSDPRDVRRALAMGTQETLFKPAGATRLTIRNYGDDRRDQMQFTWTLGEETPADDTGDPTTDTQYATCVWDYVGGTPTLVMEMAAPAGGNCAGRPCWVPIRTGGFRYKDFGLLPDGIRQLNVKAGRLGKAKVFMKARGTELPDPPMPFRQDALITVQVVNSIGKCWGSEFVSRARVNLAPRLVVKEKP